MTQKLPLVSDGETIFVRPEIKPSAYHGHLSLQGSIANDTYVQTMLQRHESEFYNQVSQLPEELRKGVFSAHKKFASREKGCESVKRLEENVSSYLELKGLEDRFVEKEREVVEAFGRTLSVDSDLRAWAENEYIGKQEYRQRFKEAVKRDNTLYGRLERVSKELGLTSNDVGAAVETLYDNLYVAPDSPFSKKELVKEVLGTGVIMSGEYPVKQKGGIGDIIPVDKGEKEHLGRKRIFAVGAAATFLGAGAAVAVYDQVAHGDPLYHAKNIIKEIGGMFSGGDQNNSAPANPDYQNWASQNFGSSNYPDSGPACDPDHDYVDNLFEFQNGTDPTKAFTYQGLDDFNLLYTYPQYFTNFSDKNLTQSQINEFLAKIPNVEPRYWTNTDGSAYGIYKSGKYVNVSLRDPLFQHLVKNVSIEWENNSEYGKIGHLKLGNEPLNLEYGRVDENKSLVPPVFYLANERKGTCGEVSTAHTAVLVSKGYKCTQTTCKVDINGEEVAHGSLESHIGGETYIVDFNSVFPKVDKNGIDTYEKWGWKMLKYDPNWLENGNFNYM